MPNVYGWCVSFLRGGAIGGARGAGARGWGGAWCRRVAGAAADLSSALGVGGVVDLAACGGGEVALATARDVAT